MHVGNRVHRPSVEWRPARPAAYGSGVLFRIWSIAVSSTSNVCVVAGGQSRVLITYAQSAPSPRDLAKEDAPGVLPARAKGYYREYTVVTPGSRDRGTRRLIAGRDGDIYYTDYHYKSFRQVVR